MPPSPSELDKKCRISLGR
jgi:hypothetical protein